MKSIGVLLIIALLVVPLSLAVMSPQEQEIIIKQAVENSMDKESEEIKAEIAYRKEELVRQVNDQVNSQLKRVQNFIVFGCIGMCAALFFTLMLFKIVEYAVDKKRRKISQLENAVSKEIKE